MKIALYIEDGLEQIVLTPESKVEKDILAKIHDGSRAMTLAKGSFYECRGGYERYTPYWQSYTYGSNEGGDESTMIVLRPAPVDRNPEGGNEVPSRSDESAVTAKPAGAQGGDA